MAEFIYQMIKARKAIGDKVILDDVTMAFFPGAKIGMVGPNGAGKSSILKIMAGLDEPSNGEARLSPGYTVGILMQEPELDDSETVIENVRMGAADTFAKLARFNEISEEMANPTRPWMRFDARRRTSRSAYSPVVSAAASLCAVCLLKLPICCFLTSQPTTWTPNRFFGLKSTFPPTPAL